MKAYTNFRLALAAPLLSLFLSLGASAQNLNRARPNAPEAGSWVVVSEPKQKSIVYFYNNDFQLIYQETLENGRLNFKRAKHQQRLNAVLTQALAQWAATRQVQADQRWLAVAIKK